MKNQFVNSIRGIIASSWITSWLGFVSMVAGIYIVLMLVGCGGELRLGGKHQSFTGKESILLEDSRADILDIIAEVGKSLGYSVSALDKRANIISLSYSSSRLALHLMGKMSSAKLTISLKNNGKRLDLDVTVFGNFGTGGQEAAMKLVNDFKAKLLENIGQ